MAGSVKERVLAAWAPHDTPVLNLEIAERALMDIGICEIPLGSNRSGRIDEYVNAVGSPLGSYWCAAAVSAWYREAGAKTPPKDAGSCDAWVAWAKASNTWTSNPAIGRAVVYGKPTDASHIGVVIRTDPLLLSVEGNTSLDAYDRNGIAVDLKKVNRLRVIGYIKPTPI